MSDRKDGKRTKLRQVGAIVYRLEADLSPRILLLTSLDTQRAIIPKGWAMKGVKDHVAAAREAFEEAGVVGKTFGKTVGNYHYWKRRKTYFSFVRVDVYPLRLQELRDDFPESGRRARGWFTPDDAALLVDEPELVMLIRRFGNRKRLGKRAA